MSAQAWVVPAPTVVVEGLYKYPDTTRAPSPRQRAASINSTAKSRQDPEPRLRVSIGVCVPSVSRLLYEIHAPTPPFRSAKRAKVSVGLLRTKPRAHDPTRSVG